MITTLLLAAQLTASYQNVRIERVYDGDTIFVTFVGVPDLFGKSIGVRVAGIDTPEMHSDSPCLRAKALEARAAMLMLITQARQVDLNFCTRDKYFRLDCAIRVDNQVDVGQYMIEHNLAVPYGGGTKLKWKC